MDEREVFFEKPHNIYAETKCVENPFEISISGYTILCLFIQPYALLCSTRTAFVLVLLSNR